METILLNFLIFVILGAISLGVLNSYQTYKIKAQLLRPIVKTALHHGLEFSFDFSAEKIHIKPEEFRKAFTEKFYEQAQIKLPKASIEKLEILQTHDQNIDIMVKTTGLFFQDIEFIYATITGSKTVWAMVSELGLLDFYLHQKAAFLRKKLEQEREVFTEIEENVSRVIKKLPVGHSHGVRQYNWDEILTTLYNRGEEDIYKQVKENYKLLTSFEKTIS